jgi:hypothetical protein
VPDVEDLDLVELGVCERQCGLCEFVLSVLPEALREYRSGVAVADSIANLSSEDVSHDPSVRSIADTRTASHN